MGTDLYEAAAELLPLVSDHNQRLALSKELPPDTPAVVDKVYQAIPPRPLTEMPRDVDPYLTEALAYGTLRCYRALAASPNEQRTELRLGLEQVRQALAYILDEESVGEDQPPQEIARWLIRVTQAPQTELGNVLGVAPKTLHRWVNDDSSPGFEETARLRVVARVVNNLRHVFTGPGVIWWFNTKHPDLKRPPIDLLNDPTKYPTIIRLAARSRSQDAT